MLTYSIIFKVTKLTTHFEYVPFTLTEDNKCMSTKEDVKLNVRRPLAGRGQGLTHSANLMMVEIFEDSEV